MGKLKALLPYGKTDGKTMAKRDLPFQFDNGTTLRTNVRTYVDKYSREISSSYVRDACEKRPKFARGVVDSPALRWPASELSTGVCVLGGAA